MRSPTSLSSLLLPDKRSTIFLSFLFCLSEIDFFVICSYFSWTAKKTVGGLATHPPPLECTYAHIRKIRLKQSYWSDKQVIWLRIGCVLEGSVFFFPRLRYMASLRVNYQRKASVRYLVQDFLQHWSPRKAVQFYVNQDLSEFSNKERYQIWKAKYFCLQCDFCINPEYVRANMCNLWKIFF